MKVIICLIALIGAVSAGSMYGGYAHHHETESKVYDAPLNKFVKIVRLVGSTDNAGNYNFDSESADGTKMSETGGLKVIKGETGATKTGSSSWTSPEGLKFSLTYTADENGYRPIGSHLPTSPPIPDEIKRVLPTLPKLDLSEYDMPSLKVKSHYMVPMMPAAPPKTYSYTASVPSTQSFLAMPPAPPAAPILTPEAPTKTHVETPDFVIDSEPTRTFFRIGY